MSRRPGKVKAWRRWVLDLKVDAWSKSVLHVLVQYGNEDGECFPSMKRIAAESGMSERKAQLVIQALAESGVIECEQSPGRRPNVYRLPANPEQRAGLDDSEPRTQYGVERDSNPARQVAQPRTSGHSTPHAVHPIGKERLCTGSAPKESGRVQSEVTTTPARGEAVLPAVVSS